MSVATQLRSHLGRAYGQRSSVLLDALLATWGRSIERAVTDGDFALAQLDLPRSAGYWLGLWGELFHVPRLSDLETDGDYASRIIHETVRPRPQNLALVQLIEETFGIHVRLVDMWPYVLHADQWVTPPGYPLQIGDSHLLPGFNDPDRPDASVRGDMVAPYGPGVFGIWLDVSSIDLFGYSLETLRRKFPRLLLSDGGNEFWGATHWAASCATTIAKAAAINDGDWGNGGSQQALIWDGNNDELWLELDLGPGIARGFTALRVYADATYAATFDVQYSDDGILWQNAVSGWNMGATAYAEVMWAAVGEHRYWRLYKTSLGDPGEWVSELQWVTPDYLAQAGDGHLTSPSLDEGSTDTARRGFGVPGGTRGVVTIADILALVERHRAAGTRGIVMNADL